MGSPDDQPEQLQAPRPGRHPHPRRPAASPLHVHDPHVQSALHPLHHPLQRTNWPLGGARHQLPPPRRLRPPPDTTQASTRTQGTTSRTTPRSGARGNASPWTRCSPSAAATRALVGRCIALLSGLNGPGGSPRTGGCGRSRCAPSRGRPPQNAGTHPATPHHPTALPVHGGSPPHGAAVAGLPHPHPKLPPPHGGRHVRHPAMPLPHPRLPPANAPARPGADMDTPQLRLHMETRTSMSSPPLPECRTSLRASTSGVRHAFERLGSSLAPISGVVSTESTLRTRGVLGQGS